MEVMLERMIKRLIRDDDEKTLQEMFRSSGPLGAFASKINLGFLLRFYGKKAHRELNFIKDIRNRFAHQLGAISFRRNRSEVLARRASQWGRRMVQPAAQRLSRLHSDGTGVHAGIVAALTAGIDAAAGQTHSVSGSFCPHRTSQSLGSNRLKREEPPPPTDGGGEAVDRDFEIC